MNKYILRAKQEAIRHTFDQNMSYRLCAIIVKGGSILSVGYNSLTANAFVRNSTLRASCFDMDHVGQHAEVHAVLKARAKTDLRKAKIYIARIRPRGQLGLAKPCKICQHVLGRYGLHRAVYSIDDDTFGVLRIKESA